MKKFLFDTADFEKPQAEAAPMCTQEQLRAAEESAYARGHADGLTQARQSQEEAMTAALARIGDSAEVLCAGENKREVAQLAAAVRLAMRVAHKLLPRFAQKFALGEIEGVIGGALEARRDEPRIAITVPTVHLESLRSRIETIAVEKGFSGQVVLLSEDSMNPSDCRVEWADGGAERLYERLYSQIENEFTRTISGMAPPPAPAEQK